MWTDKGDYHIAGSYGCEGSAQIVKATTMGQDSVQKLAFRPPLVALSCLQNFEILCTFFFFDYTTYNKRDITLS